MLHAHPACDRDPVVSAQTNVEQDSVNDLRSKHAQQLGPRRRLEHPIAVELEIQAAEHAQRRIIVRHDDGRLLPLGDGEI